MKIKQTTFFALRAIRRIYLEDETIATSTKIAEEEGVSQGVLIRILRMLVKEGILNVHQGRGRISGGFSLNKDIKEITLLDILESLEGVDITINLDAKTREKDKQLYNQINRINDVIKEEFAKYRICDLFNLPSKFPAS